MTISRRQLLALGGGAVATATLAACGSNTGRPAATPSASSSSSGGAKPTLAQWYHKYGEDGVEQAVKKWAAEYPDATVNVNWSLASNYSQAVSSALLTANAPDVFEYELGPTLDMIKAGQVADLTDIVGDAKSDFMAPLLERFTWDGKIYGIPQTVDMQLLYYRKSALSKAKQKVPTTLDELATVANAVTTSDMGGFFAGNDGGLGVLANVLIWCAGLDQFSSDNKSATFNAPALYDAVTKYKKLFDSKGMVKSASGDWYEPSAFVNSEAAMQWGGLWDMPKVQESLGDDFGVAPFPSSGGSGKQVVPFGAFGAAVNAKGKSVDAAKAFVKWLWVDQTDKQVAFSNDFGYHIPARTSLFSRADKVASGPGAEAAKLVSELGKVNSILWTPATNEAYAAALTHVVKNGNDPKAEFTAAASKANAELKRING
ncbi:ABC transporter substrate-binding protein [Nigerium massiliense]|uniref:ABC transporter substrate-binding protein n=1 Tax=Nigerium massiliense TaxID=1522317 RepID=UPI0005901D58|nr:extracellular solute-binding protein [Nigerium massiliense]